MSYRFIISSQMAGSPFLRVNNNPSWPLRTGFTVLIIVLVSSHYCGFELRPKNEYPSVLFLLCPSPADEPSRCYFHDGDGVCEEFEQKTSIKDCGVYTPQGFLDQWASNASVSHQDQQCPGWVIIGQPAASQVSSQPGGTFPTDVLCLCSVLLGCHPQM